MPLSHSSSAIRLELPMISRWRLSQNGCSAVLAEKVVVSVSRREEVLVPTPGDGRHHHSTAPAAGRPASLCDLLGLMTYLLVSMTCKSSPI
jgi:hypothetical protein